MIDYAAVVADLERQRAEIDAALTVLRPLAGAPRVPSKNGHAKGTWEEAEKWWRDGIGAVEIAKRLKCSAATVYYRAKKWPKRGAKSSAPQGAALGARVRCPECSQITEFDPCTQCGKIIRRGLRVTA